jgi:hypothetical protein
MYNVRRNVDSCSTVSSCNMRKHNEKWDGITYEETEREVAAYICWGRSRPISVIPEVTIKL